MTLYDSPFDDVAIPEQSITERVFAGLAGREDEPALIDGPSGEILTVADLIDRTRRLAGGLAARGIGRGDVVAIMAPNLPNYATLFHGVAWAGGTVTTVNPSYTADELRFQLENSGAVLLVTVPAFLETARAGAAGTAVREIATLGAAEGATAFEALFGDAAPAQAPVDLARDTLAMPYSSGTTGLPKGVRLSHRNLVANVAQVGALFRHAPGDRTIALLPFFHIYGLLVLMNYHLAAGGVVVTMPRFDLETMLRLIQEHRVRRLYVAPPIVLALAKHPLVDAYDLGSLECVFSGAAPLGAELEAACAARIGCAVVQGYGMTEMSPVSHAAPLDRRRAGASGLPVPNTRTRIVDPETGADAAPGAPGELWVKGPQVMLGYLDNPAATAATIDADGWLHTGDIVRVDADGFMFIVDRLKELIKVKGFQVAPAELEALLVTHPAIADAAVVGEPDAEAGERPVAHVVRAPGPEVDAETIIAFVAARVAGYKRLHRVVFADAIPKSPSGKILRRLLRAQA